MLGLCIDNDDANENGDNNDEVNNASFTGLQIRESYESMLDEYQNYVLLTFHLHG